MVARRAHHPLHIQLAAMDQAILVAQLVGTAQASDDVGVGLPLPDPLPDPGIDPSASLYRNIGQ